MYMYLQHHIAKDIVGERFFSTFMLGVVSKFPDNSCHGLPSSLGKGGLVFFQEGVQVDVLLKL